MSVSEFMVNIKKKKKKILVRQKKDTHGTYHG
jgi:hypothetical protein